MQRFTKNWFMHLAAITLVSGICAAAGTVETQNTTSLDVAPGDTANSGEIDKRTDRRTNDADFGNHSPEQGPTPIACDADFDGDGQVGFTDLVQLLNKWGKCDGACEEDYDGDGHIAFADLIRVLTVWGNCS